jgi:hypothetical protein
VFIAFRRFAAGIKINDGLPGPLDHARHVKNDLNLLPFVERIDNDDEGFEEDDRQQEKHYHHDAGCVSQSYSTLHAATA